jgi:Sec-independent protein translocase protein TatA
MFGIGKLTDAVSSLTYAVNRLRDTVTQVDHGIRQRLQLDPLPEPPEPAGEIEGHERINGRTRKGKPG